jgi:hypothetical protein
MHTLLYVQECQLDQLMWKVKTTEIELEKLKARYASASKRFFQDLSSELRRCEVSHKKLKGQPVSLG